MGLLSTPPIRAESDCDAKGFAVSCSKWEQYLQLMDFISTLAPGAQILVDKVTNPELPLSERIDPKVQIRHLTIEEWMLIIKAFNEWPFSPKVCQLFCGKRASAEGVSPGFINLRYIHGKGFAKTLDTLRVDNILVC